MVVKTTHILMVVTHFFPLFFSGIELSLFPNSVGAFNRSQMEGSHIRAGTPSQKGFPALIQALRIINLMPVIALPGSVIVVVAEAGPNLYPLFDGMSS